MADGSIIPPENFSHRIGNRERKREREKWRKWRNEEKAQKERAGWCIIYHGRNKKKVFRSSDWPGRRWKSRGGISFVLVHFHARIELCIVISCFTRYSLFRVGDNNLIILIFWYFDGFILYRERNKNLQNSFNSSLTSFDVKLYH